MRIGTLPLCIGSAIASAFLLGTGWIWARLVISAFQRSEGMTGLSSLPRGAYYELWGASIPRLVTGSGAFLVAVLSLYVLWRRRDTFSLLALLAYFFVLALAWIIVFAGLEFEAFD